MQNFLSECLAFFAIFCPSSFPAMTLGLGLYMQDAIVVLSQTSLVLLVHTKHGPLAIFNSVVPLKSKKASNFANLSYWLRWQLTLLSQAVGARYNCDVLPRVWLEVTLKVIKEQLWIPTTYHAHFSYLYIIISSPKLWTKFSWHRHFHWVLSVLHHSE